MDFEDKAYNLRGEIQLYYTKTGPPGPSLVVVVVRLVAYAIGVEVVSLSCEDDDDVQEPQAG